MTTVPDKLEVIFRDGLGIEPPAPEVDLVDSGVMDSLMLMTLLSEIEAEFMIKIPLEELDLQDVRTVDRLTALVDRQRSEPRSRPLPLNQDSFTLLRDGRGAAVFLLPGSPGGVLSLYPLARALDTTRPVYGVAPVPRNYRDEQLSVEDMAAVVAQTIRTTANSGACVIGGISFGGLVAFEAARQLTSAGAVVEHTVLLDSAPALTSLTRLAHVRFRFIQPFRVLHFLLGDLRSRLPELTRRGRRRLSSRRPAPAGQTATQTERSRMIVNTAREAYRPGSYSGRVTLFVTGHRPLTTFDPELVWSRRVRGEFTVERMPGRHDNFLDGPQLSTVAQKLSRLL